MSPLDLVAPALAGHREPDIYTGRTPPTLHATDDMASTSAKPADDRYPYLSLSRLCSRMIYMLIYSELKEHTY